jgi:hypothetical protein
LTRSPSCIVKKIKIKTTIPIFKNLEKFDTCWQQGNSYLGWQQIWWLCFQSILHKKKWSAGLPIFDMSGKSPGQFQSTQCWPLARAFWLSGNHQISVQWSQPNYPIMLCPIQSRHVCSAHFSILPNWWHERCYNRKRSTWTFRWYSLYPVLQYEFWSVVQEYWNICLVHVLPVLLQTFNIVLSIPTKIKSISL